MIINQYYHHCIQMFICYRDNDIDVDIDIAGSKTGYITYGKDGKDSHLYI